MARTEGRTEPEIMQGMLASHGIEATPEYAARMPGALEAATLANVARLRERGHELPGARAALTAFQAAPEVVQSVLTGNIRPDAVTKLAAFTLDSFMDFEVGGYGGDADERPGFVPVAQKRAAARYDTVFTAANTVLIGDTPRDVQAGRLGGAHVVAVATGTDSMDELLAEGADAVLPSLADTRAVLAAVHGALSA